MGNSGLLVILRGRGCLSRLSTLRVTNNAENYDTDASGIGRTTGWALTRITSTLKVLSILAARCAASLAPTELSPPPTMRLGGQVPSPPLTARTGEVARSTTSETMPITRRPTGPRPLLPSRSGPLLDHHGPRPPSPYSGRRLRHSLQPLRSCQALRRGTPALPARKGQSPRSMPCWDGSTWGTLAKRARRAVPSRYSTRESSAARRARTSWEPSVASRIFIGR